MDEDEKYYRQFMEGDSGGFEKLVIKYKNNLIFFIQRYVKDFHQAEDLAQDAFVEILVHKDRYNFKSGFKTFLFTIGKNKAIDFIRKNRRVQVMDQVEPESWEESGLLDMLIRDQENEYLRVMIGHLKEDYQKAVYLIDFEDMSYREAAGVLGKSVPQMKVLIHRARKSLKKELEKGGYGYDDR